MRWSRENSYDTIVNAEAAAQGVPPALIKAVIGQESAFVPNATRAEPQIGDASTGLMQLLAKTAKALGYTGTPQGLFDPATNIHYGTKLLSENLARVSGDIPRAVSAYNGGWRASLGFGTPFPNGQFKNQGYVNRVLANLKYFRDLDTQPVAASQAAAAGEKAGAIATALISGALLVILLYMRSRKRG
jgi:soluble lytic murein transglycosylase-like protein